MARRSIWVRKHHPDNAKAESQQLYKRKKTLFKKAAELSSKCAYSDVFVAVRNRKTGQVYIFDSSARANWINTISNLDGCFPSPIQLRLGDIIPDYGGCPSPNQAGDSGAESGKTSS
ncbi:hypothetical protein BDV11DRAFT_176401 [Aspergillus similis]